MAKKEVNMLSGNIVKGLLTISLPVMAMNVLNSLFQIVDMAILKNYDTSNGMAVGAVGVCSTLITLISSTVIGISVGANIVIAKYIGRGSRRRVERSVGTSILFSIVGGLILAIIGIIFAEVFLKWNNCPDSLLKDAALYFRLYFVGVPLFMVYTFGAAILRSAGDSRRPMNYAIICGVIKVTLTYLFVAVFKMSVTGVAISTIFSWVVPVVLYIIALLRNDGMVKLKIKHLRFYKQELKEMVTIGIPTSLQQMLYSVANVVISATVNSFGAAATTGISIANTFDGILYNISIAPSLAVIPYVSQNLGAGNMERVKKSVNRGILIASAFGITFGLLSAGFSAQLSSIMSSDPEVIAYSQQKMILISSTYFICGIQEIFGGALKGLGKPTVHTITTLIFMCGIRFVWVYGIFPLFPKEHALTFLYMVWPVGWILSLITLIAVYRPTVRKLTLKLKNPEPLEAKA